MTGDDYLALLAALLPPGAALPRQADSVLMRLLSAPAAELARIDARAAALLTEALPNTTAELLGDWETAFGLPDACSPLSTFRRASQATWFDGGGILRIAEIDEARPVIDAATGLPTGATIIELAASNGVPNPRAEGGLTGSPGTVPTGWFIVGSGGLTRTIVGFGYEAGLPYVDMRWAGTTAGASGIRVFPHGAGGRPAASVPDNANWTASWYLAIAANPGGNAPAAGSRLELRGQDAGGAALQNLVGGEWLPGAGTLRANRMVRLGTFTLAGLATAEMHYLINLLAATTYDFTLRFGPAQLEPGLAATSQMLPPVAAPAASARAADLLTVAGVDERRAALLARIVGAAGQSRAYFIALAATLGYAGATVEEFARPRAGRAVIGDAIHGFDWSQAWRLRLGAAGVRAARAGAASAGDALRSWGDERIECAVRRAAPAQTLPLFSYGV